MLMRHSKQPGPQKLGECWVFPNNHGGVFLLEMIINFGVWNGGTHHFSGNTHFGMWNLDVLWLLFPIFHLQALKWSLWLLSLIKIQVLLSDGWNVNVIIRNWYIPKKQTNMSPTKGCLFQNKSTLVFQPLCFRFHVSFRAKQPPSWSQHSQHLPAKKLVKLGQISPRIGVKIKGCVQPPASTPFLDYKKRPFP